MRRIVGRPLNAAIPASIIIGAVTVVFAVCFVVLLVVGDEIVEREPVVTRHEVDALLGLALLVAVNRGAAEKAVGDARDGAVVTAEESCERRRETGRSIPSNCRR